VQWLLVVLQAAILASRFDEVRAWLPQGVLDGGVLAQFPLLLCTGYLDNREKDETDTTSWNNKQLRASNLTYAFAFAFLAVVTQQTWEFSFGPFAGPAAKSWPLPTRAWWFFIFTFGFAFMFYLAASGTLIPAIRTIVSPLRRAPRAVVPLVLLPLGLGLGALALALIRSKKIEGLVAAVQGLLDSNTALALGVTLALTLGPLLFEVVFAGKKAESPDESKVA
jgi:hypothetical protein